MRLFVAMSLSEDVCAALADVQDALKPHSKGVRWVMPELMHLTIKFLGEVDDHRVPAVCDAVTQAARVSSPLEFEVAGCGCFPPRGPVRVVWAGVSGDLSPLLACAEAVEEQLSASGFDRERRAYSPHLTLGRVRDDRSRGQLREAVERVQLPAMFQDVEELVLMSSELSSRGPSYTPAHTVRLGG